MACVLQVTVVLVTPIHAETSLSWGIRQDVQNLTNFAAADDRSAILEITHLQSLSHMGAFVDIEVYINDTSHDKHLIFYESYRNGSVFNFHFLFKRDNGCFYKRYNKHGSILDKFDCEKMSEVQQESYNEVVYSLDQPAGDYIRILQKFDGKEVVWMFGNNFPNSKYVGRNFYDDDFVAQFLRMDWVRP